jgi:hypothetical protein
MALGVSIASTTRVVVGAGAIIHRARQGRALGHASFLPLQDIAFRQLLFGLIMGAS